MDKHLSSKEELVRVRIPPPGPKHIMSSRELQISEFRKDLHLALSSAQLREAGITSTFWDEKFREMNSRRSVRRFFKRFYSMEEVKRIYGGVKSLDLDVKLCGIRSDAARIMLLLKMCSDRYSGKTVMVQAEDVAMVRYYASRN